MPGAENVVLALVVHQHALEDFVQIQRLAGCVIVIPGEFSGIGIQRQRRVGVQRRAVARSPAGAHPRLRLGRSPVREVQVGIVAAGDPGFRAHAKDVGEASPSIASRLSRPAQWCRNAKPLCRLSIVSADEAFLPADTAPAAAQTLDQLAFHGKGSAGGGVLRPGSGRRWWYPRRPCQCGRRRPSDALRWWPRKCYRRRW